MSSRCTGRRGLSRWRDVGEMIIYIRARADAKHVIGVDRHLVREDKSLFNKEHRHSFVGLKGRQLWGYLGGAPLQSWRRQTTHSSAPAPGPQ